MPRDGLRALIESQISVDLAQLSKRNFRALVALLGYGGDPETVLAELFDSTDEIHRYVRILLHSSLTYPKNSTVIRIVQRKRFKFADLTYTRWNKVNIGYFAKRFAGPDKYDHKIKKTAEEWRISHSAARDAFTYVNKLDNWIEYFRHNFQKYDEFKDVELRCLFIYADISKKNPADCVSDRVPFLASIMQELVSQRHPYIDPGRAGIGSAYIESKSPTSL